MLAGLGATCLAVERMGWLPGARPIRSPFAYHGCAAARIHAGCARSDCLVGDIALNVGIVIVSHSPKIAEGAADMVRQMVGTTVPLAWTGGDPAGGLGTDVAKILVAIDAAWSPAGVVILVDLGGAETNAEMAIEMLDPGRRDMVGVCNAPILEGAIIAATEASGGSSVQTVRRVAEELYG